MFVLARLESPTCNEVGDGCGGSLKEYKIIIWMGPKVYIKQEYYTECRKGGIIKIIKTPVFFIISDISVLYSVCLFRIFRVAT
jgi:hypothetical protein